MAGTTYQEVVAAVGRYYGVGSDQWVQIAKYGVGAHDAEAILRQVPDVDIIKNINGDITGYAYNAPATLNPGGIASDINSNVGLGTQASGNTFKASIPASGTVNQSTGNLDMSSGAKNIQTGSTVNSVLGKISIGAAAVTMGAKLGAFIDGAIYAYDPEYWDNTFPSINPQTWSSIAGQNTLGEYFLNALFGTDSNGNTQMYLPEDVASYLAYAMAQEGFFATGESTTTAGDTWAQQQSWYNTISGYLPITSGTAIRSTDPVNGSYTEYSADVAFASVASGQTVHWLYFGSKTNNRRAVTTYDSTTGHTTTQYYTMSHATINGKDVYYTSTAISSGARAIITGPINNYGMYSSEAYLMYCILYGNTTGGAGKEGVTQQDGATFPDTSTWTSPAATGAALAQQFSDDYQNNAIYTDVPQPDGTTKRIKYIPVPATPTTGAEQQNPTNTTVTYNQTTVNEGVSPEEVVNTIIRYITQTQTQTTTETPDPPATPNPTDTGSGNTPPVVAPTGSASALWSVYNPTQAQLNSFGAWLWSSNFIDQVLKLFNNPMQSIIGVHKIFATPATSGTGNITVGYLSSGVSANLVSNQYTDINCGTIKVSEQFGNAFDYTDTQIRLYLPFIGIVDLDVTDVMRSSVSVVYHVDVITGACLAEVQIARDANGGTLYQYAGDAAVRYPISSGSYMGVVAGIASAVGGVASAVLTGGATLPMAAGAIAGGISGAHTQVQHSGNFSGNAGAMGGKKPYLIIERPQTMVADGFASYQGKGANARRTVGQMTGYFKFSDVHTDSINGAAESEIEAIRAALESGVIA